ncbi:MAG: hypothetical protein M1504_01250 [Candidatus Marsarchaeota archaeon]|nr:hypothetical protein [Candidatus Marsarchaeota archaeon]
MFKPQSVEQDTVKVGKFDLTQSTWSSGEVTYTAMGQVGLNRKQLESRLIDKGFMVNETGPNNFEISKGGITFEVAPIYDGFVSIQQLSPEVRDVETATMVVKAIVVDALYAIDPTIRNALGRKEDSN